MSKSLLFGTQIQVSAISRPTTKWHRVLAQECLKFSQIDRRGQQWSKSNYPGGFTSYGSLTNLFELSPYFADLRKKLERAARLFAGKLEWDIRPQNLQLNSMWINIMPQGTQHSLHLHPHSALSGTYYVNVPPKASAIRFEDPRLSLFMATPARKPKARPENRWFYEVQPKEGQAIFFESWLRHEVPKNQSEKPRISVSFNLDWR